MAHQTVFKDRLRGLPSLPVELLNGIVSEIVGDKIRGTFDYRYIFTTPILSNSEF